MKLTIPLELVLAVAGEPRHAGNGPTILQGIAPLEKATPSDLSFLGDLKHKTRADGCRAGCLMVPEGFAGEPADGQTLVWVSDPSVCLSAVCAVLEKDLFPQPAPGIDPGARIDPSAQLAPDVHVATGCQIAAGCRVGAGTVLGPYTILGQGVELGEGCRLGPRVHVGAWCRLGARVILHTGVVIGTDGFGYRQEGEPPALRHHKIPQIGIVIIEDDVEIGANTCIDRARFGETFIGAGTKIDNLVQIGHNVRIGRGCILCAQVGISGSASIGDFTVLWGQAGIAGHLTIGPGSFIGAQAGVPGNLPPGSKVTGTPAMPLLERRRLDALERKLPQILKRLEILEKSPKD